MKIKRQGQFEAFNLPSRDSADEWDIYITKKGECFIYDGEFWWILYDYRSPAWLSDKILELVCGSKGIYPELLFDIKFALIGKDFSSESEKLHYKSLIRTIEDIIKSYEKRKTRSTN